MFCQAGKYQQLFLLNEDEIETKEVPSISEAEVLSKRTGSLPATRPQRERNEDSGLPRKSGAWTATAVQPALTQAQTPMLQGTQDSLVTLEEESGNDLQEQVRILEEVSQITASSSVIRKRLNIVRRNGITGQELVRLLSELYHEHDMDQHEFQQRHRAEQEGDNHPRIICSEAFI